MVTTIQVSNEVKAVLDRMKIMSRESYSDVIEVIIEDGLELSEKAKSDIVDARSRIESGNFVSQEEIEKEFGL